MSLHEEDTTETAIWLLFLASRRLCHVSPSCNKDDIRAFGMMSYAVILSLHNVLLYSCSVLKRTSPLAVVSLGAYLSRGWCDALWIQCVHVIRAAASTPDDKLTGSVKATLQTGLSSRRQEAGSGGGARLVSSASSTRRVTPLPPPPHPCLMACTMLRWTAVLISARVTHLLLVTMPCASPAIRARPGANVTTVALLMFTNRVGVLRVVLRVRGPLEVAGAPAQPVPRAINPQSAPQMCRQGKVSALH